MASNERDYIIQQIRAKAEEADHSYEDFKPAEEKLYMPIQNEKWDQALEAINWTETEYDLDLDAEKEYVARIREEGKLEGIDDPEIDKDVSEGEKLLMQRQIQESEEDNVLAYTDEQIGIDHLFNLQEAVYRNTGKKSFIISNQRKWDGRISVKMGETKKKYELLSIYEDKEDTQHFKHFGESNPNKGFNKVGEFSQGFYEYKFRSGDQEYLALSTEELDTVRCKLYGTHVSLNDLTTAGENRKLASKTDIIFVHSVDPAIEVMSEEELATYMKQINHDFLAEKLLGGWRQPEWFEKFLLSIILVNDENGFPSHVLWNSEPGTGKSKVVESIIRSTGEAKQEPFTGSGSTVKGLVPSFKDNPPDEGYLLQTQRVAGVDENMDLLSNTVQSGNERVADVFRPLLNLLTHDTRSFDSGNGSIKGQMTSTMFAVGNWNAYGVRDMEELATKIDDAYLSRCIVYNQTDSHIEFINSREAEVKQRMQDEGLTEDDLFPKPDDDFISLIDTMQQRKSRVDYKKIQKLHRELCEMCPGYMLRGKFKQRGEHHMQNVLAGISKYRFLIGEKDSIDAEEEDYNQMMDIFEIIVSSWGDIELSKLSKTAQKQAITPAQRRVYNVVEDSPGCTALQIKEEVPEDEVAWILKDLKDADLVGVAEDEEGVKRIYPYWAEELEDDSVVYQEE